ncbi:MAG TPA: DUF4383 domain-containing protein [Allosphingosinicella sp.]|jgi:hypothetical protein|uniref:DUF4383 domain-containing protein n=1 Tax=Allosphingosinicella sp. TaxID=2823234 RepID=UPI002F2859A0
MNTRTFALVWGILFLLAGASGFIPGLWHPAPAHYPELAVDSFYGDAMRLFPVNILHNIVHLLFGVWGLLAYKSLSASKNYARIVAISYGLLIVLGLIPATNTLFGLVPIFGNDVWLHVILAVPAAYFGFVHRDAVISDRR